MDPLKIEHKVVGARLDVDPSTRAHAERFRLIEIAFAQALANQGNPELQKRHSALTPTGLAEDVVESVDAQLAAMGKADSLVDKAKDYAATGSSADETAPLVAVRDELTKYLTAELAFHGRQPPVNAEVKDFREGLQRGYEGALAEIDRAIKKTGAGVSPADEIRPTRTDDVALRVD